MARIIIETSNEEIIAQAEVWAKYGRAKVTIDPGDGQHPIITDTDIRDAVLGVLPYFSVKSQWAAVYRVLVDYYGFPKEMKAFCDRIGLLIKGRNVEFPCDYQSLQKAMSANGILRKPYDVWKSYQPRPDEKFFARQKRIAELLLKALREV